MNSLGSFHPIDPTKLAKLTSDDIFLVSFPRCGNSWLGSMVTHALLERAGREEGIGSRVVMDIYQDELSWRPSMELEMPFRIIKSHAIVQIAKHSMIYLFRHPADALVSYYHFNIRQYGQAFGSSITLPQFCRQLVQVYCEHLLFAMNLVRADRTKICLTSYEEIYDDPHEQLRHVMRFLSIDMPDSIVQKSVRKNDFAGFHDRDKELARSIHEFR